MLLEKSKNGWREGRMNMTAGEGCRKRLEWEREREKKGRGDCFKMKHVGVKQRKRKALNMQLQHAYI